MAYTHPDTGETIKGFPASASLLARVHPVYKTFRGWNIPTTSTKSYADLPVEAREYVEFIEDFVGVKIVWIGCGEIPSPWPIFVQAIVSSRSGNLSPLVVTDDACLGPKREDMIEK